MNIKTNDMVVVLSGKGNYKKDKEWIEKKQFKAHKVLSVDPKGGKCIVEGVNVATKHQKPRKQGEEGGIIKVSTPIYASKLAVVCPKCGKITRVGHRIGTVTISGQEKKKSIRICKKCGADL